MKRIVWILFLPLLLHSYTAEEIAIKAEQKLRSIKSLKAHFSQTYISKSLMTPLREKGEFYFKRNGLMKWVYQEPEKKTFLLKNGTFFFYIPEDNQLIKSSLSAYTQESEILELLSGTLQIHDTYHTEFSRSQKDQTKLYNLTLIPREEKEYSSISLEIERSTWLIQKAVFFDWAGNKTEFFFSRIKTNISLPPDTFELKLPKDVEIIEDIHY